MICGLQAAVAGRAAGMLLEVFQQREVQVLVQRLVGADDFLVDRQREVDAWQVDADLQALEVGFVGAPGMVAHRVDGGAERQLILGGLGGVDAGLAGGVAHAQPAGGRQFGHAVRRMAELVGREHARPDLAAVGVAQVDVIVQVGRAGLQGHAHAVQQGGQRIGLQREALGLGVFVQGIADLGGDQAVALDLFQEVMQQRLVGAAKARLHAGLGQAGLGGAARLGVLEQPALEVRAAPGRRHVGVGPGVQRAVECFVQQ